VAVSGEDPRLAELTDLLGGKQLRDQRDHHPLSFEEFRDAWRYREFRAQVLPLGNGRNAQEFEAKINSILFGTPGQGKKHEHIPAEESSEVVRLSVISTSSAAFSNTALSA